MALNRKTVAALALACFGLVAVGAGLSALSTDPRVAAKGLSRTLSIANVPRENPAVLPSAPDMAEAVLLRSASLAKSAQHEALSRKGLGKLYEGRWKLRSAAKEYEHGVALAVQAGVDAEALRVDLARVLFKDGDLEGAAAHATGTSPEAQLQLGLVRSAQGLYNDSQQLIAQARSGFVRAHDEDGVLRADAAECDRLQLDRRLMQAREKCMALLVRLPVLHAERPTVEKVLGMVHYFSGNSALALATHQRAADGYRSQARLVEADWVEEMLVDDQAAAYADAGMTADDPAYTILDARFTQRIDALMAMEEVIWWRVSDAELRMSDLLRKMKRYADAKVHYDKSLAAFEKRPGYERIPDYATFFEFDAMLQRDLGNKEASLAALTRCHEVLAKIVGETNADVQYLRDELASVKELVES